MAGPGEYVPDVTEGITRVEDLPKPRIERRSRNYPARRCRRCGRRAGRYAVASRTLHDLGDPDSGRPVDLVVTYSKHRCPHCGRCFSRRSVRPGLAQVPVHPPRPATGCPPGGRGRPALPSRQLAPLARPPRLRPLRHHPELGRGGWGKKRWSSLSTTYLDEALADFSGYLAIDEVYDGPFCILSVVDNRRYNRLAFRVLDHDPTQDDVRAFLSEFKAQLDKRGLKRARHHHGRLVALPQGAQEVVARGPPPDVQVPRHQGDHQGGPARPGETPQGDDSARSPSSRVAGPAKSSRARRGRWPAQKRRVAELFEHRYLFVRHHLSTAQSRSSCGS